MAQYQFERESRTPYSEAFIIYTDGTATGRVDVHYGPDLVHATICVPEDASEDDIQEIIGDVDERLVMSAHPFREDFVATVWLGRQAGVYSEEFEDGEDEAEEEIEGNGHRD